MANLDWDDGGPDLHREQWDEMAQVRAEIRALKARIEALEQAQRLGKRDLLAGLHQAIERSAVGGGR